MELGLKGKTALVTGSSRGIGRGIALALAAEGCDVMLVGRDRAALDDTAAAVGKSGARAAIAVIDLREKDAPAKLIEQVRRECGALDILVNNAGATKRGDFLALSDADWEDGYALKFFGAMRGSRAAWPHLRSSGGGIVNIVGIGGRTGSAEFTIGGAVNASVLNLTKCLADRGLKEGVRVNAINPGSIVTDRLQIRLREFAAEQHMEVAVASREMASAF